MLIGKETKQLPGPKTCIKVSLLCVFQLWDIASRFFLALNKREGGGELNRRGSSNILSREVPVCSAPLLVL